MIEARISPVTVTETALELLDGDKLECGLSKAEENVENDPLVRWYDVFQTFHDDSI